MTARAWLLFVLSSVIWGVPYLFIKIAVDSGLAPGFVAWSRIALAALVVLPLAGRRPFTALRSRAAAIIGYTVSEMAVPFVLIAMGERYISSSLTAILIATMPLMVALLSLPTGERLTRTRTVGLLLGLGGVVALLGIDVAGRPSELLGAGLVLVATLGYALAPIIVTRQLADLDPLGPVAASLAIASIALLPFAIADWPQRVPDLLPLLAIAILGVICTALGLIVFFRLIAEAGPNRASVVTYMNPVVAVLLGVAVLGERLSAVGVVGLVLILVGSWISAGGSHP